MASASSRHNIESSKSRKRVEIDFDQLAKELADIDKGEGFSTKDIMEKLNCGNAKARDFIRKAQNAGLCRVSQRRELNITGQWQKCPSYVFEKGVK